MRIRGSIEKLLSLSSNYIFMSSKKETKPALHKPSIFIASSWESRAVAEAVKLNLDTIAEVDIWTENIFKLNEGFLETLTNRASYYDFFIAIFSSDDTSVVRRKKKKTTRDNVIFEFGLFLGRIGINRTFFILEKDTDLFSDWKGISVVEFERRDNLTAAVGSACIKIKEKMGIAEKLFDYTVLPSTSLAIGYYNNFLKPVLYAFEHEKSITVIEKDKNGEIINEAVH